MLGWIGGDFHPETFLVDIVNRSLASIRRHYQKTEPMEDPSGLIPRTHTCRKLNCGSEGFGTTADNDKVKPLHSG